MVAEESPRPCWRNELNGGPQGEMSMSYSPDLILKRLFDRIEMRASGVFR